MTKPNIKFSQEDKPEFIQELREKVKDYLAANHLSGKGNTELFLKSVFMLSLYLVPFILMLSGVVSSTSGIFLCWLIMGLGMAGIGMGLMHDANHRAFSKKSGVNSLMSNSLYLLGGYPPAWQYQHNSLHHGFTNIEGFDEDINPVRILRFSPHKPLKRIHRYQYIYAWFLYGMMTLAFITTNDFNIIKRQRKDEVKLTGNNTYGKLIFLLVLSKILYYSVILVLPIILLPVPWYLTLLFFLAMHFVSGLILSTIFQTAHVMPTSAFPIPDENGKVENNWAIHQLRTTTDYSPRSRIFAWFVGGLNHQVIHHLFPNISHVHYRKIAVIVSETAKKYDVPYHVCDNFALAIREHIKMLKRLGR
jgi:linoleoyl-CoA desaturase